MNFKTIIFKNEKKHANIIKNSSDRLTNSCGRYFPLPLLFMDLKDHLYYFWNLY